MSKDKIKIATSYKRNNDKEPLLTVVEFCLERGGKLTRNWPNGPFHTDAAGTSRCTVIGDTTLQDVLDAFDFPDYFVFGTPENQTIWDDKHHTKVILTSLEKYEKSQAISAEQEAEIQALAAEARRKRALKNGG